MKKIKGLEKKLKDLRTVVRREFHKAEITSVNLYPHLGKNVLNVHFDAFPSDGAGNVCFTYIFDEGVFTFGGNKYLKIKDLKKVYDNLPHHRDEKRELTIVAKMDGFNFVVESAEYTGE